ncbi:MAG TPA: biliverdin-producing heme oxygenase [Kofleriaceae bacterium]|nr:biliverdin-producing heme oxygenase [Kofleriaceae bacterium]
MSPLHVHVSKDTYRDFLAKVYGFEAPVEVSLASTPGIASAIDLKPLSHLDLLRADLASLGVHNVAELPHGRMAPRFGSLGEALGWIYVIEHNALLHGQVRRHVRKHLAPLADSYLAAGERFGSTRLQQLGGLLDRVAREPDVGRVVVEAVKAGFRSQRQWFARAVPPGNIQPIRVA